MDNTIVRNALNSMLEATKEDATPIVRRLARVQTRAALDALDAQAGAVADMRERCAKAIEEWEDWGQWYGLDRNNAVAQEVSKDAAKFLRTLPLTPDGGGEA